MKSKKGLDHPIDILRYEFIEVWWNGHWNKCSYEGWEPITEDHFTEPKDNSQYRIVYTARPISISNPKRILPDWEGVHSSRVRPYKED